MIVSVENLFLALGAIFLSLLSYLVSKTFKDLIKSVEYNSLILARIQTEIAVFTEKFNSFTYNLDKLETKVQDYNEKNRVKFDKFDTLAVEFQECRKNCQRCVDNKAK